MAKEKPLHAQGERDKLTLRMAGEEVRIFEAVYLCAGNV